MQEMDEMLSGLQEEITTIVERTDWDVRGTPDFQVRVIEIKGSLIRLSNKLASARSKFISR